MSIIRFKKRLVIKTIVIISLLLIILKYNIEDELNVNSEEIFYSENFKNSFKNRIIRSRYDVDCKSIFEMNKIEIEKAKNLLKNLKSNKNKQIPILNDENYIFNKSVCPIFKSLRGYDRFFSSQKNKFNLAYSILTHSNTEQFERLLKLIYHPQNIYCIHIDSKSSESFKKAIKSIVDCFENVFIASKLENVFYASYNRLQADINCLNDLFNLNKLINKHENFMNKKIVNWQYFFNFASTEFPLRTFKEINQILKIYNGSNEIEIIKKFNFNRINLKWKSDLKENRLYATNETKSQVPHNYKIVKGYAYIVISRKFAEYAIFDQKAKDLLDWSRDTWSPDEWFWSTLQYNTQYFNQSGFKDIQSSARINTLSRFAGWGGEYLCKGKWRHGVCVFSIEDLPEMITRPHFVSNKFLIEFDPISYQCMEDWFLEKETTKITLSMYYYCNFLKMHSTIIDCPEFIKN